MYFNGFLYAFALTVVALIFFIPVLRIVKCGQIIRLEGPKEHYRKSGTPTMGGLIITLSFTIVFILTALFYLESSFQLILIYLLPVYIYMIIGLLDDYLIVVKKNNKGISPKIKIILQLIGVTIYLYLLRKMEIGTTINLFFFKVDLRFGYYILILLMFVASANAVNITDGLDGLATGLIIIALFGIAIISYYKKDSLTLLFTVEVIASLLAFMIFNANPAKIFMGNTGALMLGAVIANLMILLDEEMLLIIIGLVFIIETLSVIAQVTYFKLTKGKRIFLMSPLHHHFEKKGFSEWKVDAVFWILGLIATAIAVYLVLI